MGLPKARLASPIADILELALEHSAYWCYSCTEHRLSRTQPRRLVKNARPNLLFEETDPASCVIIIATRSHTFTTEMRLVTLAAAVGLLAALPSALTAAVPSRDGDSVPSDQLLFTAPSETEQIPLPAAANNDDDFARVKLTLGVMSRCPDAVLVETLFDRVLERKTSSGLGDNAPETVAGLVDLRLDYIARFVFLVSGNVALPSGVSERKTTPPHTLTDPPNMPIVAAKTRRHFTTRRASTGISNVAVTSSSCAPPTSGRLRPLATVTANTRPTRTRAGT